MNNALLARRMYEATVAGAPHAELWEKLPQHWRNQFLRHADVAITYFREASQPPFLVEVDDA